MAEPPSAGAVRPGHGPCNDQVAGLGLAALAAAVAIECRNLPLGGLSNPGPGYYPLLLAILLGALGFAVAVRGGRSPAFAGLGWREGPRAAAILGACAFAAASLEHLGYRMTMIALIVFLVGVVERRPPLAVALAALGLSLGSFYLFYTLLRVPLPLGPWNF